MKRIAAITMARNDNFFLERWIAYYGQNLGYENLYVMLDGKDQTPPACPDDVNIEIMERKAEEMTKGDRTRIALINRKAEQLLGSYDLVIGCDADEFLVVDPAAGKGLKEYLSSVKCRVCISGLGMDVGQKMDEESALDGSQPFLSQRRYALLDSQYTKPVVKAVAKEWGAGFHRVKGCNYHIDSNLYLFHFGSVDYDMLMAKTTDAEKCSEGWSKHLNQRFRTINLLTRNKIHTNENYIKLARVLQRVIRHPFMWTRPYMYYWKMVVRIPERFNGVI